jgi:hypothetical protein
MHKFELVYQLQHETGTWNKVTNNFYLENGVVNKLSDHIITYKGEKFVMVELDISPYSYSFWLAKESKPIKVGDSIIIRGIEVKLIQTERHPSKVMAISKETYIRWADAVAVENTTNISKIEMKAITGSDMWVKRNG